MVVYFGIFRPTFRWFDMRFGLGLVESHFRAPPRFQVLSGEGIMMMMMMMMMMLDFWF